MILQAGTTEISTNLLTYGPIGVLSVAFLSALKLMIGFYQEKSKQVDQTNTAMIESLKTRDKSHEEALAAIAISMGKVADRLDHLGQEQIRSSTLLSVLARTVTGPDGRRFTEKELRDIIRSGQSQT